MSKAEKSIEIKAPPEKIWEMLAFDKLPEWMDWLTKVEYTSEINAPEDKFRTSATAHGTPKTGPEFNCQFEVKESLEYEKIKHWIWERAKDKILGAFITYTLEPVDGATKLSFIAGDLVMPWGILGKIMGLFMLIANGRAFGKYLKNPKTILEK